MNKNNKVFLIIGPSLFFVFYFLFPYTLFPDTASKAAVGTIIWMAFWWITAPVDYAVTALLPIAVNSVFQMCDMSLVIQNYASETILLLLGASILTVSWEETGLDKRIAARFLSIIGDKFRIQMFFWFIMSAILSSVLPNAVVCATITPIAVSMLKYVGEGNISESKIGSKLLLNIAYAAGVGGLATPLGGAMNLVTVDYIQQITGMEYMYTSWVIRYLPIVIVLIISNFIFMIRDIKPDESLGGSRQYFKREYKKFPQITLEEKLSLVLFIVAMILSFSRQLYKEYFPGLKPAYIFIICAILSFLIPGAGGKRLMTWKSVQTKIVWELIYVFAGGLAAGTLINQSGAAQAIGNAVADMGFDRGFFTVGVIITCTLLLSDVTSNTATAAVAIPIVISITNGMGLNPIPYIYIATVGVNLSYMLPTSIRAIPVGYGLKPQYMFSEGWKLSLIVIVLMAIICSFMLYRWEMFSTV